MRIGVWERDEGLAAAWAAALAGRGAEVAAGRHPAELAAPPPELLVVSPGALGWAGAGAVRCRTALLPGAAVPLARAVRAGQAVSYGPSPRDSLTFSSLEGGRLCLAVQRELRPLAGPPGEQQELVLPFPAGASPLPLLAAAGALLLAGVPPAELGARLARAGPGAPPG